MSPGQRGILGLGLALALSLSFVDLELWPPLVATLATGFVLAQILLRAVSLWRAASAEEVLATSTAERGCRCPFCHGDLEAGETVEACAACETVHHASCREEFGACATLGCTAPEVAGRRFAIAPDPITGWAHPEAIDLEGEVATPFPDGINFDRETGLKLDRLPGH